MNKRACACVREAESICACERECVRERVCEEKSERECARESVFVPKRKKRMCVCE